MIKDHGIRMAQRGPDRSSNLTHHPILFAATSTSINVPTYCAILNLSSFSIKETSESIFYLFRCQHNHDYLAFFFPVIFALFHILLSNGVLKKNLSSFFANCVNIEYYRVGHCDFIVLCFLRNYFRVFEIPT